MTAIADARFDVIAARYRGLDGVTSGTGFGGNPGVRVGGRIFAMLVNDALVVKLSGPRAAELASAGIGRPFEVGRRVMREWLTVPADSAADWSALVDEAFAFVSAVR
jgi:hypothetical protein